MHTNCTSNDAQNQTEQIKLMVEQLRSSANVILDTSDVDRVQFHLYLSLRELSLAIEVFDVRLTTLENKERGEK
ncbi:hypothetical protein LCGC14_2247260 [marine sediment metagenome]|uniref:Uncharacterized protein n=1 Tax=marine sediment metagenome TaxID=412755 RepID=A0A0F9FGA2_9ZZZZ